MSQLDIIFLTGCAVASTFFLGIIASCAVKQKNAIMAIHRMIYNLVHGEFPPEG
mgnify:CR=1|jgi:hypothetical protein|tara:strand:- start:2566 stop:2727 length:162 start_codon:yes stop_codon:yes gene_type:complete